MVGWQQRTPEPTAALGTILTQAYKVTIARKGGGAAKGLPALGSTQTTASSLPSLSVNAEVKGNTKLGRVGLWDS